MEDQTNFPGHRRPDFAHAPPHQGQTPQPPQGAYPGVPAPYQFQQQPQYAPGPHPGAYSMPPLHDQPYGSPPPSTMGAPWAPPQPPQGQHPPGAYNPMFAPPGPSAPSEPQVGMHINPVVAAGVISQAGNMFQGSQAYLQQKMGFLNSGDLQHHFNINAQYVRKKLLLLLTPYLGRWDYTRGTMYSDTGAHGPKQRPPRDDTFAPDLYIPLMAFCTYCILLGLTQMLGGTFKPALMYQNVTSASIAWGVHMLVLKACTSVMHIPPLQYIELACYSGYPFAMIALSIVFGWLLGGWGFYASAGYGALCSAAFLVRTLKKAVWTYYSQINDQPGMSTNYLLLFVGLFQFPFAFFMGMTVPAATA